MWVAKGNVYPELISPNDQDRNSVLGERTKKVLVRITKLEMLPDVGYGKCVVSTYCENLGMKKSFSWL